MHAKNDFNQIKENFLDFQRKANASGSPDQVIVHTCPFTSSNQAFNSQPEYMSLIFKKGQSNLSFCKFLT